MYFAHFANINLQVYWCEPAIVMLLFGLRKKTAGMRSGNHGIMTRGWGWLVRIGTPWWRSKKPDLTIGKGNLAVQRLVSWDRTLRSHYCNMVCHLSHVLLLHKKLIPVFMDCKHTCWTLHSRQTFAERSIGAIYDTHISVIKSVAVYLFFGWILLF